MATVAGLCRSSHALKHLLLPAVPPDRMEYLMAAVGAARHSPRRVTFSDPSMCLARVPLPLWRSSLSNTEELTLPWLGHADYDCVLHGADESESDLLSNNLTAVTALNSLPQLRRLHLHHAVLLAGDMVSVVLPRLEALSLVAPTFRAGAASALVSSLGLHSPALAHLSVQRWRGELLQATYALRLVPSLRTLSLGNDGADAGDCQMSAALCALSLTLPALTITHKHPGCEEEDADEEEVRGSDSEGSA